ncbi:hypothetical protein ACK31V_11535 [Aeromonas caviae]
MLVKIDESIISAYGEDKRKFKCGLNYILDAHFNKKHFVYLSQKIAKQIIKLNKDSWNNYLSNEIVSKVEQLGNQCALQAAITTLVNIYIEIYHNKIAYPITNVDPGIESATVWKYPITSNLEWLINPTVIYGENINDSGIFESIAKSTALLKGLSNRNIKFRKEMTGGCGNIPEIVNTRSNDPQDLKSACFFIADSDCKYPKNSIHKIIKDSRDNLRNYNYNAPMRLDILQSREIENLIPIELLYLSLEAKAKQEKSIREALQAIDTFYRQHPEHYRYIDLKEGTCTHKVAADLACKKFFKPLEGVVKPPCNDQNHKDCFQITPRIGDIILPTLKEYLKLHGDRHLSQLILQKNTEEWTKLAEILLSFSICNDRQAM